jgi:signal transduction histidine kinase
MSDSTVQHAVPTPSYNLADAFDQLPVGVAIFDTSDQFRCLRHNPRLLNMISDSLPEHGSLIGAPLRDLLAPETYAETLPIFAQVRASGVPFTADEYAVVIRAEVRPRYFQWSLTPLRGPDGGVSALLASGIEITARKTFEAEASAAARRANEERALLDTLIDAAPIGVAFLDRDLRFVRINERLAQLNGLPATAHLGRYIGELLPNLAAAIEPLALQALATGRPVTNIDVMKPTAAYHGSAWLKNFYPVPDPAGEILGVGVLVTDISDERRMQEELRATTTRERERVADLETLLNDRKIADQERAQLYAAERQARAEAEAALQIRDTFFSMAAHELKTPLTAMLGQVQLIERRAAQSHTLSERDQRSVRAIRSQATRLNRLIGAMLDITRIEQGYLSLERDQVDLAALARRVVDEIQPAYPQHHFRWRGPTSSLQISGDAIRLEQVLYNLVENAVKYSPRGGEITVSVEGDDRIARISVRDHGLGIAAADLPHLFERFYRSQSVQERHIPGMGIGLHVVREIVRLHEGEVSVESAEGEGSCFSVTLPVDSAHT